MTDEEKTALKVLGYSGSSWDNREPFSNYQFWGDLTDEQKAAARVLGYKQVRWNNRAGQAKSPPHVNKAWGQLTIYEQAALEVLGFTQTLWDEGTSPLPVSVFKPWDHLIVCGERRLSSIAIMLSWGMRVTSFNNDVLGLHFRIVVLIFVHSNNILKGCTCEQNDEK